LARLEWLSNSDSEREGSDGRGQNPVLQTSLQRVDVQEAEW
jgi:hypothetical protein